MLVPCKTEEQQAEGNEKGGKKSRFSPVTKENREGKRGSSLA